MSATTKRPCEEGGGDKESKHLHTDCGQFLQWCKDQNIVCSPKVTVQRQGSCAQCGMVALEDISKGETLFTIPRPALLHPGTCSLALAQRLQNDPALKSQSGWVPLILAVMYEHTKPDSRWRPYLDLFPDHDQLDPPMFWERNIVEEELSGTGILESVERDLENIEKEYSEVALPFMKRNPDIFRLEAHTLEHYKKAVAFVMAYSFTEPEDEVDDEEEGGNDRVGGTTGGARKPNAPMMVPLADALNHIAKNNAHLKFGTQSLSMVATKDITQGSEVYNTYGELANWQLLHMYGFAEEYPQNIFDTVDIPNQALFDEVKASGADAALLDEKWEFLMEVGVVTDDGSFVIGMDGVLTEEELYTTLKVLSMGKDEFEKYQTDEGWCSDDGNEESLSNEDIPALPKPWRCLLASSARRCLDRLDALHPADTSRSSAQGAVDRMTPRSRYAFLVRTGQRKLLQRVRELCESDS